MAEPLKNQFGPAVPQKIAEMISQVFPKFESGAFLDDVLKGYKALELIARGWHIARTLHHFLPGDYEEAMEILLASLGPELDRTEDVGMAPFLYLPHVLFVAEFGIDHFDISMNAQYELTKRFTAEFSIRSFLIRYPKQTMAILKSWAGDSNVHVRRLVSEGTRPRLPWAFRLPDFQKDPRPVLKLLELLKDDPDLYVRRSVANNLNDIGKDHPDLLIKTVKRWKKNVTPERDWLIRHALRSAVKRGERAALEVLGYGSTATVAIRNVQISPRKARMGDSVGIFFEVVNTDSQGQSLLVDFRVHFLKANGKTRPKVFKLKTVDLSHHEKARLGKKISLKEMTTRKHYSGTHKVDAVLNGYVIPLGEFELAGT